MPNAISSRSLQWILVWLKIFPRELLRDSSIEGPLRIYYLICSLLPRAGGEPLDSPRGNNRFHLKEVRFFSSLSCTASGILFLIFYIIFFPLSFFRSLDHPPSGHAESRIFLLAALVISGVVRMSYQRVNHKEI